MSQTINQILNFDDTDLAANRLGKLTEKQRSLLGEKYKTNQNKNLMIGILIAIIFCGSFVGRFIPALINSVGIKPGGIDSSSLTPILPFIIIGGIFFLVFGTIIFFVLRVVFGKARQQADTSVRRVEGKVNFVWVEREERNLSSAGPMFKKVRSLEMRLGGETFTVNHELPNVINQGEEWIFYYTNHPFKFLSAEQVK